MDWIMISAISTAFMALVILITAIFAVLQLKEISRSRQLNAFTDLSQSLQREEIRKARRILIEASVKNFIDWSKEEIEAAEKACHTYDTTGIMVSERLIEKDLVVNKWRYFIIRCWEAAKPMIMEYKKERGKDFWCDFELLYKEAKKIETAHDTL